MNVSTYYRLLKYQRANRLIDVIRRKTVFVPVSQQPWQGVIKECIAVDDENSVTISTGTIYYGAV